MNTIRIPFVDLHAQYLNHREEFDAAFREVIGKSAFIGGEFVREFEDCYAAAYGVKHCIAVGNGTDAIYIVLKMLGVTSGDEVITTAASWISTSETISQTGAKPVFVDVDEFHNIDVDAIEAKITSKTKAIIPVHLFGQAAQTELINEIAQRNNLFLIEDCAQAHFAERQIGGNSEQHRRVGTTGIAGTFSFYPGKNLGAYGDAGAIVTNDDELASRCRMYANHGALKKHHHEIEGINSRMDGLQGALLTKKLRHLPAWTQARRAVAAKYDEYLSQIPNIKTPRIRPGSTHVYHLYVVRCQLRGLLKNWLEADGIETGIHYPTALPLLPAYKALGLSSKDFPRAASYQEQILSLPIYPEMTDQMVRRVSESIKAFYNSQPK